MVAHPWTEAEDATLRSLHAAGRSLHSIAGEMGRAKRTISDHSARLGLTWDRSKTAAATTARVVDNKARRTAIVARLYAQVEGELKALEDAPSGWRTILKGEYGVENEATLTFAPPLDRRNVADVISRHLTSAAKLEQIDAGDRPAAARDLLTGLGQHLGINDAAA